jgi:hypothetical protein
MGDPFEGDEGDMGLDPMANEEEPGYEDYEP